MPPRRRTVTRNEVGWCVAEVWGGGRTPNSAVRRSHARATATVSAGFPLRFAMSASVFEGCGGDDGAVHGQHPGGGDRLGFHR